MSKEEFKYFRFPVTLLQGFLVDEINVLHNIYAYAIYVKSTSYYEKEEFEWIINEGIEKVVELSDNYFGTNTKDKLETFKYGKSIHKGILSKTPMTNINVKTWRKYYRNEKTEFEKICLLAHLALISNCQGKPFTIMEKHFLYSRMDGEVKSYGSFFKADNRKLIFPELEVVENLSVEIRKYATKRYWDKIKKELVEKWYWVIPTRLPKMNKNGVLEIKINRGINYFTQLDEETFYKALITIEKKKYEEKKKGGQILNDLVAKYNS